MVRIGMETVAARLATFDAAQQPVAKGRPSGAKPKPSNWPYLRPSPIDLAQAGFFYNPTPISPDNTTCYLCERALDGWEDDDDPVTEHIRHSAECGWAIMMTIARESSNPAQIDDPTSQFIVDARKATFCSWPHEGKRGWLCKTDKMVEAGWYFCPNDESEDFVSCAYCKLSLDGFEPKDDPFDEHYRRSPDCSFFQFATSSASKPAKKSTRGKKTRTSKASRTSTQSTATTASEAAHTEDDMDQSTISQSAPKSSARSSKKPQKSKGRGRKAKKDDPAETGSQMEVETEASDTQPSTKTKGKKRNSEEISGYEEATQNEIDPSQHGPPTKRRATKTRNVGNKSTISVSENSELSGSEEQPSRTTRKGSKAGRKKKNTSKARKPAATTKSSSKSRLPKDSELDAQLEAQLAKLDSDAMEVDKQDHAVEPPDQTAGGELQLEQQKNPPGKPKGAGTDKTTVNTNSKAIPDSILILSSDPDFDMDNSIVPVSAPSAKGRKGGEAASHEDTPKKATSTLKSSNKAQQRRTTEQESLVYMGTQEKTAAMNGNDGSESPVHDQEMMSIGTHESPAAPENRQATREESPSVIQMDKINDKNTQDNDLHIHTDITSPPAPTQERTPSASPQSSDAENRPPSSMQNMLSASKEKPTEASRAKGTTATSPSKKQAHGAQLSTTLPWNPVDIDEVLLGGADGKGNANLSGILHSVKGGLTALEEQMTVEEWIQSNATSAEEKLKAECEKLVSVFEQESARAMRALEGIECIE